MQQLDFKLLAILLLSCIQWIAPPPARSENFPHYEIIQPNITFWEKIYTTYPTTQAVVHDSIHLDVVYAVIDLKPHDVPGARKINRQRMQRARKKYQAVLERLADDPDAEDPEAGRVALLFGPEAGSRDFKRAAERVRCQIGQMDRFRAGLIRSGAYIEAIRRILKFYGVPEDLAYLPHVESSFEVKAYSKFGAAGMWQFTRSTGRRFMTVGYEIDERRDPIRATHAAAKLLKENFEKLGSWPLAVTAYNHGAAGMERAKAKHGDYPTIFQVYRSRSFKFASRNFYAEFLAARQVAANYEQFFKNLKMAEPVPTQTFELTGYAAFADLCRHFDVDPETLKALNPALRPPVINGQKYVPPGYHLRLKSSGHKDARWAAIPENIYHATQKPSRFYTVQRGDTAYRIAHSHGVRLDDLIAANNLDRRATIYPRQTLRLPRPNVKAPVTVPPPANLVSVSEAPAEDKSTPTTEQTPHPSAPERPDVDQAAQPASEALPRPTMASLLPLPLRDATPAVPDTPPATTATAPSTEIVAADVRFERIVDIEGRPVGILVVEVEETLGHYAEWAGVRTQTIRHLNGLPIGHTLHLHQKVRVPLHRIGQAAFEELRYEFHKRLQEDFFAVYRVSERDTYRVQRGDSYWALCRDKFDIPLWLLKHYNSEADLADLRVRQKLVVPIIEETAGGDPATVAPDDPLRKDVDG